jgi:hypothetical protein
MPVFTFSNPNPISFHYTQTTNLKVSYAAKPYPSKISVFALPPNISDISVHLYDLQANILNNLSILLVAPNNHSNLVLLNAIDNSSNPQSNVNISIIDHTPLMPQSNSLIDNLPYSPTSYGNVYPPPLSPGSPYNQPGKVGVASFFSAFIESNIPLDGLWSLYVFSYGEEISAFQIGGWSISFYTRI